MIIFINIILNPLLRTESNTFLYEVMKYQRHGDHTPVFTSITHHNKGLCITATQLTYFFSIWLFQRGQSGQY